MLYIESTSPNVKLDLAKLADTVRAMHTRVAAAEKDALHHAMDAGDALIAVHELIPHGQWKAWVTRCGLNKRTAERYTQLAKARSTIETGKASRTTHLSIASALRLISKKTTATDPKKGPKPTTKSTPGLSSLAWADASIEERRHFLDAAGLAAVLEAIPASWREAIIDGASPSTVKPTPTKLPCDNSRPLHLIADIVIPEKVAA